MFERLSSDVLSKRRQTRVLGAPELSSNAGNRRESTAIGVSFFGSFFGQAKKGQKKHRSSGLKFKNDFLIGNIFFASANAAWRLTFLCLSKEKFSKRNDSPSRVGFTDPLRGSDCAGAHKTRVYPRVLKKSDDKRSNSCSLRPANLALLGSLKGRWVL